MTRATNQNRRALLRHALAGAVLFQGLSGVGGGVGLLADPTGELLGIPITWLQGSPFPDYFLPGLILLVVLGVLPLLVSWGLWKRRGWAWPAGLAIGVALLVWILVEVLVVGYQPDPPLQAIYGALGVIILALATAGRVGVPHGEE